MDNTLINNLIDSEIVFSDELAKKYKYPDNITHLLYVIIPSFIIKYGINNKKIIEKCFNDTPIKIDDKQDKVYQAYYFSYPVYTDSVINDIKGIVLNNYENIGLMQLVDNLVHEYNHAVNSIQNTVKIDNTVSIRTGLSHNYFDKETLHFIKKSDEAILEEVINTKQTELIINIIKSFSNYEINNSTVQTTLYSINHSIDHDYHSNSYLLGSYVCTKLLENKTFLSTLEILRFDGDVDNIHTWFDDIVGEDKALDRLLKYLNAIMEEYNKYRKAILFKQSKINKIRDLNTKAMYIVDKFYQNTIYK